MKHSSPKAKARPWVAPWFCGFVLGFPLLTVAADSAQRGLDVILLIDVSGSMAEKNGQIDDAYETGNWNGSDPDRIRWDAVKMLVDLLDANDRILILRFNETCPARTGTYIGDVNPLKDLYLPGRIPLTSENDFSRTLQFCDGKMQQELSSRIAYFNHPLSNKPRKNLKESQHEDGWKLDGGGTNIIDALGTLASPVTNFCLRDLPGRPKCIILLTDGCDQNIDQFVDNPDGEESSIDYQPRINRRRLSESLAFLRPTLESRSVAAENKVPVYTVGLKLQDLPNDKALVTEESAREGLGKVGDRRMQNVWVRQGDTLRLRPDFPEPHFQQQKARALLTTMSEMTGGEFHDLDDADDLLNLYTSLIRNLKGLWYRKEELPHRDGAVLTIPVVSAVEDFRLLARVKNSQKDSKGGGKWSTRPPVFEAGSWQPPTSALPLPVLRQGSGKSLYALWFGGDLVTPTPGAPRPAHFAHLDGSVNWVVPVGKESSPIETVHFKRVSENFGWPPRAPNPSSEVQFYRHQLATIHLSAVTDMIEAADFEWKLMQRTGEKLEELPISFRDVGTDSLATFDPDKVKTQTWTNSRGSQSLSWTLFAQGKPTKAPPEKVLTGFSREFPPWRFFILNELLIRIRESVATIALSEDDTRQEWTVETPFPQSAAKIPMKLTFIRPQFKNAAGQMVPIDAELLTLAVVGADNKATPLDVSDDGTSRFDLKDGRARLRLQFESLEKSHFPPAGAEIHQGRLRMEADLADLAKSTVLELPVGLVFDKPQLEFYEDPAKTTAAKRATATPIKDEPHRVEVFLAPIKPRGTGKRIALTLNYTTHPKDVGDQPLPLSSDEFRVLDESGTELEKDADAWITEFTGKPIRLVLETKLAKDRRADSTAVATLSAVGPGFVQGDLDVRWTFPPREVDMQLDGEGEPVRVEPGQVARYLVTGKISNHSEAARVPVAERIRERGVHFENVDRQKADTDFYVPLRDTDWFGVNGKNGSSPWRTEVPLLIPEGQPVGEYRASLAFEETAEIGDGDTKERVSTRLKRPPITLNLILDRLIAEIQDPHDPTKWITATRKVGDQEEYHFLFYGYLGSPFERRLRIRSERGEKLTATNTSPLKEVYTLTTDVGRAAASPLVCRPAKTGEQSLPEWFITFPQLLNYDPVLDFGTRLTIERDRSLQRTLKFKLRLLSEPEPK